MSSSWLLLHFPTAEWGLCGGLPAFQGNSCRWEYDHKAEKHCGALYHSQLQTAAMIPQSWAGCRRWAWLTVDDSQPEPALGVISVGGEDPIPTNQVSYHTGTHTHTRVHTFALHKPTCLLEQVATHVMRNGMQIREKLLLMSKYLPMDFNLFFSPDGRMAPR